MESQDDLEEGGLPDFLRDPRGILRRHWPWMLVALVVGLGTTLIYVFLLQKPVFVARATVMVASQQIPEDFVRPTVQENAFERINAMFAEVLSRDKLAGLIEKHDLYPLLRESLSTVDLVSRMRDNISISRDSGIGKTARYESARLFTISFRADAPKLAADIANDLASLFIESSIRMRTDQARLTTEFLRVELALAEKELREHEHLITDFQERYRGELPSELSGNLNKLERLQQQRQSLALQISDAATRLAMLSVGQDPESPEIRLAPLRAELAERLGVYTNEHPDVIALRRQIGLLETQIEEREAGALDGEPTTRTTLVAAAQRTLSELRRQRANAEAGIVDLDARVGRTPARQEELTALEQKVGVLREKYLEFLRKVQEAGLAENLESAQQGGRVSVMDRALPPASPDQVRDKYLGIGVFISLAFGLGVGLLSELRDPVLVTSDQIESRFRVPVVGSVPRIN